MSDFFEPPAPIDREREVRNEWDGPPMAVVPAIVPIERIIARTAELAVYLVSISAYRTSFGFDLVVVTADGRDQIDPFDFDYRVQAERTGEIPPGQLRLGLLFADGSKATNTDEHFCWYDGSGKPPDAPVMRGGGSGSISDGWRASFWVWPLPPPGKLEFLCECPGAGIPLTRSALDSAAILEAATRAEELFPDR